MNSFFKIIIKLAILLLVLILIDLFIGLIFTILLNRQTDGRYYKIRYSLENSYEDIIILGSSHAETNYNPSIISKNLGMSCWNAGRGGQGLIYIYSIEQEILSRYSPKYLIINIEVNMLEGNIDYDKVAILRPFVKKHPAIFDALSKKDKFEKFKLKSNIYKYNSSLFYFLRSFFIKNKDGKPSDKGWKPLNGMINSFLVSSNNKINTKGVILNKDKIRLLNKIISSATKQNVRIIFVVSPEYYGVYNKSCTLNYIQANNNENKFAFFDYSSDLRFNEKPQYFNDISHLSLNGANTFTEELSTKIKHSFNLKY